MKTKFICALTVAMVLGVGCGGEEPRGRARNTPGEQILLDAVVSVNGTAKLFPVAESWLAGRGQQAPSLEGLTLQLEDPLRSALSDVDGLWGTMTLEASGAFEAKAVLVQWVNLGIAAGVLDEREQGNTSGTSASFVRSTTLLYDVEQMEEKPQFAIENAEAFVLPRAFHDHLTSLTSSQIQMWSNQQQTTLVGTGFILGQVVDAAGNPVAGVKLAADEEHPKLTNHFVYPNGALDGLQWSTSPNGLFIFIHDGQAIDPFTFGVAGHPEYKVQSAAPHGGVAVLTLVKP